MFQVTLPQLRASRKSLGVNCAATKSEIRAAFLRKALKDHPDKWFNASRIKQLMAHRRWCTAVKAYNLLKKYESPYQKSRKHLGSLTNSAARRRFAIVLRSEVYRF